MPLTLNCACGKILRIADEHAGKRVKCPACSAVIASKPPEPAFEVVEDEPQQLAPARPVARPAAKSVDDDDDTRGYGLTKAERTADPPVTKPIFRRRATDDDDDDDDPRPRRRSARQAGATAGAEAGRRISFILGGICGLVIGAGLAVWGFNGTGRGATKLLIFGSILAIFGLISLVQGITGNLPEED